RMPSFARERLKVLAKFTGIREALAAAFDADPEKLKATFHRVEHHVAHLASSFYCSPFEEAALLSADGLGDFASSMWGAGFGPRRSEEHTSELQSRSDLVCRLLLEKKKTDRKSTD